MNEYRSGLLNHSEQVSHVGVQTPKTHPCQAGSERIKLSAECFKHGNGPLHPKQTSGVARPIKHGWSIRLLPSWCWVEAWHPTPVTCRTWTPYKSLHNTKQGWVPGGTPGR